MFPATGSTTTTATSCPRAAISRETASRSLNGSATVSAASAAGTPTLAGAPEGARRVRPAACGHAEGGAPRSRLHEQAVGMAVVAAVELHHEVAAGGAARET